MSDEEQKTARLKHADTLAHLVSLMIGYLDRQPPHTLGGQWRRDAQEALSKFNATKIPSRQRKLF